MNPLPKRTWVVFTLRGKTWDSFQRWNVCPVIIMGTLHHLWIPETKNWTNMGQKYLHKMMPAPQNGLWLIIVLMRSGFFVRWPCRSCQSVIISLFHFQMARSVLTSMYLRCIPLLVWLMGWKLTQSAMKNDTSEVMWEDTNIKMQHG